jgi:hypothetical protein
LYFVIKIKKGYRMSQGFVNPQPITLPVPVADGGTGRTGATAYAVQCGGTTSTGAHQSIASVGTSGQVLTSNGAGALPTFQAVAGVNGDVKAWINLDGSAATPAARASANISSITDNGTGDYTLNYTNALVDANYAIVGMVRFTSNGAITAGGESGGASWQAAGSSRVNILNTPGGLVDALYALFIVVR